MKTANVGDRAITAESILRDPRIRRVAWRDLVRVRPHEVVLELCLPALFVAPSLSFFSRGLLVPALVLSFLFFLVGLRVVHNAFHRALGLPHWATEVVLWVLSAAMLGSMHAVRFNHMRHHAHLLDDEDVEGRSAAMSVGGALLYGPVFPVLLHRTAWRHGTPGLRATIAGQLLLNAVTLALVFGVIRSSALECHFLAMAVGQCMTAFFAVWTVHHHCDRTHYIARTLRNRIKNAVTFNMFLHVEHHLFPRVPTCHWPKLSQRIDRVAPELKEKLVF